MLLLPAILQSYQSKVDKSFKVVFSTNELSPEQAAALVEKTTLKDLSTLLW